MKKYVISRCDFENHCRIKFYRNKEVTDILVYSGKTNLPNLSEPSSIIEAEDISGCIEKYISQHFKKGGVDITKMSLDCLDNNRWNLYYTQEGADTKIYKYFIKEFE